MYIVIYKKAEQEKNRPAFLSRMGYLGVTYFKTISGLSSGGSPRRRAAIVISKTISSEVTVTVVFASRAGAASISFIILLIYLKAFFSRRAKKFSI